MLAGNPVAAGLLALCSGERLSEVACSLTRHQAASSAVRSALDLGWERAAGVQSDPGEIAVVLSDFDVLFGSPDFEVPEHQSALNDSVVAAEYALRAVTGGAPQAAVDALDHCRNVYFQMAVKTWPRLDVDALNNSPVVQAEIRREVREAQTIASLGTVIAAEAVAILRRAAHADSEVLIRLLRGEAPTKAEPRPPSFQGTLF
jgi:hypothetical protein